MCECHCNCPALVCPAGKEEASRRAGDAGFGGHGRLSSLQPVVLNVAAASDAVVAARAPGHLLWMLVVVSLVLVARQ